jgi:hypothetical protein
MNTQADMRCFTCHRKKAYCSEDGYFCMVCDAPHECNGNFGASHEFPWDEKLRKLALKTGRAINSYQNKRLAKT